MRYVETQKTKNCKERKTRIKQGQRISKACLN